MKRALTLVFLYLLFLSYVQPQLFLQSTLAANQTSGTFYGFDWEYGLQSRNFTQSLDFSQSFSESESETNTKTYTLTAPIRTKLEIIDVLWQRWTNRTLIAPSITWEPPGSPQNWHSYRVDGLLSNKTDYLGAWYRYAGINVDHWGSLIQALNISDGYQQIDIGLAAEDNSWHTNYTLLTPVVNVTVPMQDSLGVVYDSMNVTMYHIGYIYNSGTPVDTTDDILVFQELLVPQFVLIEVKTKITQISVTETSSVAASLSGAFNTSGTWEENLYGQHVSIKDGFNYWFDYFALISGYVNFAYSGGFSLKGSLSSNVTRDVIYTNNGSIVNESVRPAWLQSLRIVIAGEWDHSHTESGTLYGKGAIQSIIQVLLTQATTDQEQNIAAWGNFNPGRMIGYKDINGDGILTAFLNQSQIATPDAIMAIGFPEGAHLASTYHAEDLADAEVFISFGDWTIVNETASVDIITDTVVDETWGYDPRDPGTGPSNVNLVWMDPLETNGKAIFEWETTYSNTPVTWWARNDSTAIITQDEADITYGYSLTIDPELGEAILESTYQQSEIQDITLKNMVNSQTMSMATYYRDYYLSMTQTSADMSGAFARQESKFDMTVAGKDLFSQDFGGKKETYFLHNAPSSTLTVGTSVLNLLAAEGFSGEPTNKTEENIFSSPVSKRIATALTQWSADNQNPGVSWIFRENIVITSYPIWNGEGITHDPAFTAIYVGTGARDSDSTDEPSLPDQITTTKEGGVPGFGLTTSLIFFITVALFLRKRKRS
ncbi:MAG: hypothetical protein ACFFDT_25455 [Candidatus Hodarchaeota archaeon]